MKSQNKNLLFITPILMLILVFLLSASSVRSQTPQPIDVKDNCCVYLKDPQGGGRCFSSVCSEFDNQEENYKTGLCFTSVSGTSLENLTHSCTCKKGDGLCGNRIKDNGEDCDYAAIPSGCTGIDQCNEECKCTTITPQGCNAYVDNNQCTASGNGYQPCQNEINGCNFEGICKTNAGTCQCGIPDYIHAYEGTDCVGLVTRVDPRDGTTYEACACPDQGCTFHDSETGIDEPGVCHAYEASASDPLRCHCIPKDHCGDGIFYPNYGEECDEEPSVARPDGCAELQGAIEPDTTFCDECRCSGVCFQYSNDGRETCESHTCRVSENTRDCVYDPGDPSDPDKPPVCKCPSTVLELISVPDSDNSNYRNLNPGDNSSQEGCPDTQLNCGGVCCSADQCTNQTDPNNGICCSAQTPVQENVNGICCNIGEINCNGSCCTNDRCANNQQCCSSPEQVCGSICCNTGESCVGNSCVISGGGGMGPDSDGDGTPDILDGCPNDPNKTSPGICGCGISDADSDGDGTVDCKDGCPSDRNKTSPGSCGCGNLETNPCRTPPSTGCQTQKLDAGYSTCANPGTPCGTHFNGQSCTCQTITSGCGCFVSGSTYASPCTPSTQLEPF